MDGIGAGIPSLIEKVKFTAAFWDSIVPCADTLKVHFDAFVKRTVANADQCLNWISNVNWIKRPK